MFVIVRASVTMPRMSHFPLMKDDCAHRQKEYKDGSHVLDIL